MSQECPNCGQLTNASYSRLVKDSCGHTKCRMCLLYEEHGCKTCQAVCCTQDIQDYREACSTSNDPDDTNKANNEENILPLELVINKNTKSKEHHNYNPTSIEHRLPSFHHKDVSFSNNKRAYESVTNDAIDNNDSDKLYIPKVEPSNMVLNIEAHLRNGSNQNDLANLENPQADRNCSTKSRNQQPRQKQKSRKTQPKSPGKVVANSTANSHQINSRLDPMGNITPVIRTTAEVSNAVSVINGPISTRRLEERACKKMFTYMEPIPIAEAAVLNCRIEEKLYPQSANSHNYFVHNYLKDRNSKVNSYPNNDNDNELESRDNSNAIATISSSIQSSLPKTTTSQEEPATSIREDKCHRDEGKTKKVDESTGRGDETSVSTERLDATSPRDEQSNCVSTIKKHTVQQLVADGCNSSASGNFGGTATHCATLPKDFQNSSKRKQSDVHWRRRTAETLKPCRH
ncbi:hypothetical protein EAI_09399 [Harpegnathos saltator]|uniref:Uncharacterized protein n=1 Tax=Harpegnathos saltator TaxID=610380 RepID=E2BQI2_HARSA|nr:hypothetical protein EAI_09399 [Harpegnathos saltator]